jgi:hypothetical protein
MAAGARWTAFASVAAVVALPALAALHGARHPPPVVLDLGPGDAPYVAGFTREYEIDEGVATHWTTYRAGVSLPLELRGASLRVSYRFARVFGETAQVEVTAGGRTLDRFSARGGRWVERAAAVDAPPGPLALAIVSDSHERQDRGLKLDWVRFEADGGRLLLRGPARWGPALLVALAVLLFRLLGWSPARAALLALPLALALGAGLVVDPWLVHRVLRGIPLALALFGLAGVFVGRLLRARGRVSETTLRRLGALAVAAFLLRAAAVSHPHFYYPDQRTHARLVEQLQKDGLGFFVAPARSIAAHGVWRTFAYGRVHAFPYTPAFHLPFAPLRLPYDTLLVAMKLTAAAVSVVPLLLVWALARRLRASPLGALLMLFIPTYTSRLSFAFLPSLFGHALDMAFLYWLLGRLDRLLDRRTWLAGAAWVTTCQLAYVSGVINIPTLLFSLALLWLLRGTPPRARTAAVILGLGLLGSAASVLLYYRDFLGMALDVTQRAASGGPASHYPVQGWWTVAWGRTRDFFGFVYPVLAVAGLFTLRRARGALLLVAWVLAYALLLLGRARMPDVFLHGHETLFLTPLVCLASGQALAVLARGPRWRQAAAVLLVAALAGQGFWGQWKALAAQLGNAR